MKNFIFCTREGLFDCRHLMCLGFMVMAVSILFVANSEIQARTLSEGELLARQVKQNKNRLVSLPGITVSEKSGSEKSGIFQPDNMEASFVSLAEKLGLKEQKVSLTRIAAVKEAPRQSPYLEAGDRVSCSVEAVRAAAKGGDTRLISPCVTALLSGEEDAFVNLPEKMSAFFIETANDPEKRKNMPLIFVNSMMAMMEAVTGQKIDK